VTKISRLLRWSDSASVRGHFWWSGVLLELDLLFAGLSGAAKHIENDRAKRQANPPARFWVRFEPTPQDDSYTIAVKEQQRARRERQSLPPASFDLVGDDVRWRQ
jgi:hypothetical protein